MTLFDFIGDGFAAFATSAWAGFFAAVYAILSGLLGN